MKEESARIKPGGFFFHPSNLLTDIGPLTYGI
jgi:hypothetical protein